MKPEGRPVVVGFKSRYRVGDVLNMTCLVRDTFPAVNMSWFVSGKLVSDVLPMIFY